MKTLTGLYTALALLRFKALRLKIRPCPACGPSVIVRFGENGLAVRCMRCGASAIHLSILAVLKTMVPSLKEKHIYELSSRGPLFEYVKRESKKLTYSEHIDNVPYGKFLNGVQCQNIEQLTYNDENFDICTSTEVFEHVACDQTGFREIYRVLKPGGVFIFTVPLTKCNETVERAVLENGMIRHILPPEYHGDRLRGQNKVLVFRDYGLDITERLQSSGFKRTEIVTPENLLLWNYERDVIVGWK